MSKHITEEQRYAISMMLQIPMSKKAIAEAIGVDKSTVYREIKRNCDARSGSYSMELAQRKADRRKQQKHRKEVLTPAMRKRIIKLLKKGFSPEQIVGRSRLEGIAMVSHETIYRWIWEDKRRGGKLHKYLRRQGRRYAKRGSKNAGRGFIPGRVDIDERPEIVELKERFGDLEIDTIIGKNHKGAILTINDRATSRVWIRKLSGKEAIPVAKIAVWALRKVKNLIHTITADNGKEFAKHEEIAQKLEIKFYFCKPYHSWERGANENTNGLIRQYIPKGKDFSEVTNKQIKWIENKLNNRPRKRLGYLTPNEKFKQIINQNSTCKCKPDEKYTYQGANLLVDGLQGDDNYRSGRYIGLYGQNFDAIIDLQETKEISSVSLGTYLVPGDYIFGLTGLEIYGSNDGSAYSKIASKTIPVLEKGSKNNVLKRDTVSFGKTKARYVRIIGKNTPVLPKWHPGAGKRTYLFLDEITID